MLSNENVKILDLRRCTLAMRRFQEWRRWKLLLPLIMLLVFYPIYIFVEVPSPFLNAFAHGDLLLFSALILFEVSVEADHIRRELQHVNTSLDDLAEWPRVCGIVLIVLYGSMKLAVGPHAEVSNKTVAYCFFTISIMCIAVSYSYYAFWKTLETAVKDIL